MRQYHAIMATAGHVDHGKSSLVKALTGMDPDRLPEEKARGITIDLGFAHLTLSGPGTQLRSYHVGIVDVPGHEDFVKNMVTGVGSIDLALLVVAADDGWMPQTEEHLQILTYLGVARGVVALTKIDLAKENEAGVTNAIREQLRGTALAEAPIVPTSVVSQRGISPLREALAQVLSQAPEEPREIGKPRLGIDRAFTLKGIGTVVTGTLTGGHFQRGQSVIIQPSQIVTRLRTIQSHNEELDSVGPATRTALSLADVPLTQKGSSDGVRRGQMITLAEFGLPADAFDVLLQRSARPIQGRAQSARPLKDGSRVRVHHGTANLTARVLLLGKNELGPGESSLAQLRFDSPVFAFIGDRFIVRDWSEQTTLAGGLVLNPDAIRRGFRGPAHQNHLRQFAESMGDAGAAIEVWIDRYKISRRSSLLAKSNFSAAEIKAGCEQLQTAGKVIFPGDFIAASGWWSNVRSQAIAAIDTHHRAHSEAPGLPLSQLRAALKDPLPWNEAFSALVAELLRTGFIQTGTAIQRASHRPALPPALQSSGAQLRSALSAKPFDPPSRKDLADNAVTQQALRFLIQTGEAVEIGAELVLLAESYRKAVQLITDHLRNGRPATVSELKQLIGTSRRVIVPLLERMDREGLTKRQGDVRVLR